MVCPCVHRSAEKHPAKGIFARVEGPRRRTRDVVSEQVRAWQARLHGREPGFDSPHAQRAHVTPSQDPGLPDAVRERPSHVEEPSQREEASQASQSSGGDVAPATARPGAATQQRFMLQDSEEQEDIQQTRPGSGAQRPVFLLDSEEQEELMQPDSTESPGQRIIQILDSEDQDRLHQPGVISLPGPSAAGESSDLAAAGREEPASEAAAIGAASHQQQDVLVQETQTEGDFEAGIAHLPAKMQRELRGLQRPWHFDPCVLNPANFGLCHSACDKGGLHLIHHASGPSKCDLAGVWQSTQSTWPDSVQSIPSARSVSQRGSSLRVCRSPFAASSPHRLGLLGFPSCHCLIALAHVLRLPCLIAVQCEAVCRRQHGGG